ncbi:MAG TPA: SDR family oxidoreductase [Solirubrobacteraceae bacterium]|nr:SDR family oxidoreductase [Solirubrobacteraceae bacterium]
MNPTTGDVLLTGTTGFIGMELLARYLERSDRGIVALVRAPSAEAARARIDTVLENLFGDQWRAYTDRVEVVPADMTAPGLGLDPRDRDRLAERVTTIVHSAASVSFTLPLTEAREINVAGTQRMLEFAELAQQRGGLSCYGHVSTAYVAGTHAGRFCERDLDLGQSFHNSYEQSKFEAEQLVRAHEGLPSRILRPSIVVGDRNSGWTAAFNVLYWPLRALSRGLFSAVPAVPTAPVDVVSIDYVADAIHALCEDRTRPARAGETYHLIAGRNASTMAEIIGRASRYFRKPAPAVLPPAEFATLPPRSVAQDSALAAGSVYFPYFSMDTVFEDEETRARLEPAGILASPLSDYLERLLDFATRSGWGKRPIARFDAGGVAVANR